MGAVQLRTDVRLQVILGLGLLIALAIIVVAWVLRGSRHAGYEALGGVEGEKMVQLAIDAQQAESIRQSQVYSEQLETAEKQMQRSEQQLERSEQQQQRQEALLLRNERQSDRVEALLSRQEKQADRYDKLLEKWEAEGRARTP